MHAGTLYLETRERVVALVVDLSASQLATVVPAAPHWTVKDLLAHLVGVADDVLAGRLEGVATEPWTATQVLARRGHRHSDLLEEWQRLSQPYAELLDAAGEDGAGAVVDLVTHEHDLRGATGKPGGRDGAAFALAQRAYWNGFSARVQERGLPALAVRTPGRPLLAGSGTPGAQVEVDAFELFRGLAGRRSTAQVRGWRWSTDPQHYLDVLSVFGELPSRDVRED